MKKYSFQLFIRIVFLLLGLLLLLITLQYQLWGSLFFSVVIIAIGISLLYQLHWKTIRMMERLERGLRYKETTLRIPPPFSDKRIKELSENLSDAISCFRSQLLNEESHHQYYKLLLEKVESALIVCHIDGSIEWCNQAATAILSSRNTLPPTLLKAIRENNKVIHFQDKDKKWDLAAETTVFMSQGKKFLLIGLTNIHNVLEHNEMESWQKLVRVLTHEIMNSITPIISLSETLSEREVPAVPSVNDYSLMHQAMQTIHRRSKGLLTFVENYRKLTKLPAPVLNSFTIDSLFDDLKKLFPAECIHFETAQTQLTLNADRIQIEQVLINLIKNAVEASKEMEHPTIQVQCFTQNGRIRILVKDNGKGILPEVLDKIFVPFFTTKPSGSGIGLTLCKQIMTLHNGLLDVTSEKDKGSCFTLYF